MKCLWSEPQSAPSVVFADCIELLHLQLQRIYQSNFSIDHPVMSMCRVISFSFFSVSGWGTDLDYCDTEWFTLKTNRDHSVFEITPKYCTSDSFGDYEGYSISSKEFLSTVVDKMVMWIKFTHSPSILVHCFIKCKCAKCNRFIKCQCSLLPSPARPRPIYLDSWI